MLLRIAISSGAFNGFRMASRFLSSAAAVKVPTELLKQLRERTGSPMMECKNALAEANLDLEKAVDVLRKKGAVHASKAAGRTASCGLVAASVSANKRIATLVELNCETDFVERNERFQAGLENISAGVLSTVAASSLSGTVDANGSSQLIVESVKAAKAESGAVIADEVNMLVSAIRENILLRRAASLTVEHGVIGSYVHNSVRPTLGRVASLVSLKFPAAVSSNAEQLSALQLLADRLAMHAAGLKPAHLNRAAVPADVVQREEAVHVEAVRASKKPDNVVKNIVAGKMGKFYSEVCLSEQTFAVPDSPAEEVSVNKLIANQAKRLELNVDDVQLSGFVVYEVGKGVVAAPEPAKTL